MAELPSIRLRGTPPPQESKRDRSQESVGFRVEILDDCCDQFPRDVIEVNWQGVPRQEHKVLPGKVKLIQIELKGRNLNRFLEEATYGENFSALHRIEVTEGIVLESCIFSRQMNIGRLESLLSGIAARSPALHRLEFRSCRGFRVSDVLCDDILMSVGPLKVLRILDNEPYPNVTDRTLTFHADTIRLLELDGRPGITGNGIRSIVNSWKAQSDQKSGIRMKEFQSGCARFPASIHGIQINLNHCHDVDLSSLGNLGVPIKTRVGINNGTLFEDHQLALPRPNLKDYDRLGVNRKIHVCPSFCRDPLKEVEEEMVIKQSDMASIDSSQTSRDSGMVKCSSILSLVSVDQLNSILSEDNGNSANSHTTRMRPPPRAQGIPKSLKKDSMAKGGEGLLSTETLISCGKNGFAQNKSRGLFVRVLGDWSAGKIADYMQKMISKMVSRRWEAESSTAPPGLRLHEITGKLASFVNGNEDIIVLKEIFDFVDVAAAPSPPVYIPFLLDTWTKLISEIRVKNRHAMIFVVGPHNIYADHIWQNPNAVAHFVEKYSQELEDHLKTYHTKVWFLPISTSLKESGGPSLVEGVHLTDYGRRRVANEIMKTVMRSLEVKLKKDSGMYRPQYSD